MQLNLAIVQDNLSDYTFLQKQVDPMARLHLKYPLVYTPDSVFREDILYIATSESLPVLPQFPEHLSLICLGFPPAAYYGERCETLILPTSQDLSSLFENVQNVFYKFNMYDIELRHKLMQSRKKSEIAELIFEIFQTPVTVMDQFEHTVLLSYDNNNPIELDYYLNSAAITDDERSILYNNKEFVESMQLREPTKFCSPIYKTQIIFYNYFENDVYSGRILLENTYREFLDSDYRLVEWVGELLFLLISKERKYFSFPASAAFSQMIDQFLIHNLPYKMEFDDILLRESWHRDDKYMVFAITTAFNDFSKGTAYLQDGAFYLTELFDAQYIYIEETMILQIINISCSQYSLPELLRRMRTFLKGAFYYAGTSEKFQDFAETAIYIKQAKMLASYALKKRENRLFEFKENILDVMLHKINDGMNGDVYITEALRCLQKYDQDNGSELFKTLVAYIQNLRNVTKTMEQLYVARSTCLYRLERIQQIAQIDFENPDTFLYLSLLLRLGNY